MVGIVLVSKGVTEIKKNIQYESSKDRLQEKQNILLRLQTVQYNQY